jgi:hypothetical protein
MKFCLMFSLILISFSVSAEKSCALYELSGHVVLEKSGMILLIAKKTMSEKKLSVAVEQQSPLMPYVDRYITGTFIVSGNKILAAKKVTDAIPDPLNQNQQSTSKKLKDEKCPKL